MRQPDSFGWVHVAGNDQVHADLCINSTTTFAFESEALLLVVVDEQTVMEDTLDVTVEQYCVDCVLPPGDGALVQHNPVDCVTVVAVVVLRSRQGDDVTVTSHDDDVTG